MSRKRGVLITKEIRERALIEQRSLFDRCFLFCTDYKKRHKLIIFMRIRAPPTSDFDEKQNLKIVGKHEKNILHT